jgi:hypothetical protein
MDSFQPGKPVLPGFPLRARVCQYLCICYVHSYYSYCMICAYVMVPSALMILMAFMATFCLLLCCLSLHLFRYPRMVDPVPSGCRF